MFFDHDYWDGSDLFNPEGEGAGWPWVTDRARAALLAGGVRGIDFEPLSEMEWWD